MFDDRTEKLFGLFGGGKTMALATEKDGRVTARTMSFVVYREKFYFQTDSAMTKARQIAANPNVAICFENWQIEGTCRQTGRPSDEENRFFLERYKKLFPGACEKYSRLENERLFEVTPVKIAIWDYENGRPYMDLYDLAQNSCRREYFAVYGENFPDP